MLVSTKYLSLMQFVPRSRRRPAQIKTFSQAGDSAFAGLLISFTLTHELFQLQCQQGADGTAFLGSENACFPQKLSFNFQGYVRFHISTILRAALFYV